MITETTPEEIETIHREVDVRIVNVKFPRSRKSLIGVVDIALDIAGIQIIIANLSVHRFKDEIHIIAPKYRDACGINRDILLLPQEINEIVADLVLSLFVKVEGDESVH